MSYQRSDVEALYNLIRDSDCLPRGDPRSRLATRELLHNDDLRSLVPDICFSCILTVGAFDWIRASRHEEDIYALLAQSANSSFMNGLSRRIDVNRMLIVLDSSLQLAFVPEYYWDTVDLRQVERWRLSFEQDVIHAQCVQTGKARVYWANR